MSFPQGRNITQYQFIDDYTLAIGKHTFKFGENFRRYDVSDHNFFFNNPAVYFGYTNDGLQNFVDGIGYQYRVRPDSTIDGTFTGSLSSILPRLFRDKDYVLRIEPNHSITVFIMSP